MDWGGLEQGQMPECCGSDDDVMMMMMSSTQ